MPIAGDLSKPRLGVNEANNERIAGALPVIGITGLAGIVGISFVIWKMGSIADCFSFICFYNCKNCEKEPYV